MTKHALILITILLLSACTLSPEPISVNERYTTARENVSRIFAQQKVSTKHITYYQSLALGLKNNLDYRIKIANNALQADQLTLAEFAMFPALNTSASVYTRSNSLASFGTTSTGQLTDVLNSTPRTLRSLRVGLSWNILDFGVSYIRAKQQGDRYLVAQEEARKQLQQLTQDIRRAYWEAYSAQELSHETQKFQLLLVDANNKLNQAIADPTVPKENILHYQEALLDGKRHLIQLRYKYDKAMLDLKHLVNLPLGVHFVLATPPEGLYKVQDLKHLDFRKVDAITLVNRPELTSQGYQVRIARLGIRAAVLQALPGITLNPGWNYNSNKFLVNNLWMDRSVDAAWNLLNLASLPSSLDSAESSVEFEKLKLMAVTLAVLTETRFSYSRYQNLVSEYNIARNQTENANALYELTEHRYEASLANYQQAVVAKLKVITSKMDEDLLLSDLATALGELYLSTGFDILPYEVSNQPVPVIVTAIEKRFSSNKTMDFKAYVNKTYSQLFKKKSRIARR